MLASQQVLERVQQLLLAANTAAGSQVHLGRGHAVSVYPALKVAHGGEDLQADEDGDAVTWPARRLHELQVEVMAFVESGTDMDGALAALATQVLLALEGTVAAATLQPLPACTLRATSLRYQLGSEGQAAHGIATLGFEASFRTASNDPETLI